MVGYWEMTLLGRGITSNGYDDFVYSRDRDCVHVLLSGAEADLSLDVLPKAITSASRKEMDIVATEVGAFIGRFDPFCDHNYVVGWGTAGPVAVKLAFQQRLRGGPGVTGYSFAGDVAGYLGEEYFPMAFDITISRGAWSMRTDRMRTPHLYIAPLSKSGGILGVLQSLDIGLGRAPTPEVTRERQ
jgi:hypothetical protein